MNKIHRYAKLKNILKCILRFDDESKSLYNWHSYNVFRRGLYRAIETCPGFVDTAILEYCSEILEIREKTHESIIKVKDLAKKALEEISWEERSGNDLYPCIEID